MHAPWLHRPEVEDSRRVWSGEEDVLRRVPLLLPRVLLALLDGVLCSPDGALHSVSENAELFEFGEQLQELSQPTASVPDWPLVRVPQGIIKEWQQAVHPETSVVLFDPEHDALEEQEGVHSDVDEDEEELIFQGQESRVTSTTVRPTSFL